MSRAFTECDNHRVQGGPHKSRALVVTRYFDHPATVVMCTARVGRIHKPVRQVCGNEYLILDEEAR